MATPPAPTTVGRYKVLKPLGEGGMGRIFLAEDPVLGRKLAVKLLPPEVQNDPERRERLVQEARAASALNHPNILVVHDLGEAGGLLFVAMELVDGQTLRVWMDSAPGGKPHPPGTSLRLLRQAARGLAAAHGAGIVHRDLKPENLMVRADGILKILDFGLAQTASLGPQDRTIPVSPGTPGRGLVGTVPYMSPEQVLGQAAEPASDLFSLGVVLYEMLTGEHPFAATHAVDTLQRIVHEMPAPPSTRNRDLSPLVDFVMAKALAKDPARRHGSARDLENDLAALEESLRPAGTVPPADPAVAPVPARAGSGPEASSTRAVAVLPFKNIGGNPELGYLGMGLADAVITQLAASPDLIVRATSTVAGYQNKAIDPRRVGEELEADAVLDASFQQVADRLRVTARLVEAATGRALWAGKVEVRSEDVFELQDRVAQNIAQVFTLRDRVARGVARGSDSDSTPRPAEGAAPLSRESDSRNAPIARAAAGGPSRGFTPSPAAYDNYLRGMEAMRSWTLGGWKRSIAHFEEAVRLEPRFARAWAMLGEVYQSMASSGWDVNETWFERAEEALDRAREIDPDEGYAYYLSGSLHIARGRPAEAWKDLQKALAKMPHFWVVHHYLAYACRISDLLEEAIEIEQRAVSVEPNVPWAYTPIARMYSVLGNRTEAWQWLERGRMRAGPHPMFEYSEMGLLADEERWEEIIGRFADRVEAEKMIHRGLPLAIAYLRTGSRDRGDAIVRSTESSAEVDMDAAATVALYWAWAGDADRAFHFLERGEELGFRILRALENPAYFGPIHGDPRWKPYIERVRGKVEELKKVLVWPLG